MSRRLKNRYFSSNSTSNKNSTENSGATAVASLNQIFDRFRDKHDPPDTITVNGCMAYFQEIGCSLEEPTVLVIAEMLQAPTMGEFSRSGFVAGWQSYQVSSLDHMRELVPALRSSLITDEATFKKVYMFTYSFARSAPNQKSLPLEVAVEYWKLLLADRFAEHLPVWTQFLVIEWKKSIAKDTWNCMYDFVQLAARDPTLGTYDVDGAWPSILDDFVIYYRKWKEAGGKMETD